MAKRQRAGGRRARAAGALRELIELSRALGVDRDLVQGGGGNTSVKTRDSETMFVKASGAELRDMDADRGWAEVELEPVRALAEDRSLRALDPAERERRVRERLQLAVIRPSGARPSVESSIHALLGRVVIHTHPVHLNSILCARGGGEEARELVRGIAGPPIVLGYVDPGYVLGTELHRAITEYRAREGREPAIVILENHGVFVSDDDPSRCARIHRRVTERAKKRTGRGTINVSPHETRPASRRRKARALEEPPRDSAVEIRGALLRAGVAAGVVRRDETEIAREWIANTPAIAVAKRGAFTPDQIVYCRTQPLVLSETRSATWERSAATYRERHGLDPRVIIAPGDGVYYASSQPRELEVIGDVYRSAMVPLLDRTKSARLLTKREAAFIEGWEVEAFRARLLAGESRRLTGRIAVVTGAASGLGKGIALGLASEGAIIAGCDVNRDLLATAEREFPAGHFVPLECDVTDEVSVDAAFAAVAARLGGLDILVNAAGIAPSFPLVDFPLGAWRKTLEINLTGYFLCARAAARVLLRQDAGGSIVNVTSKSGLDASKSNSAYNATKAGEIHLMRGWALELGSKKIRVNCVAPGNVFQGSQIWNAEYIRAAAKKKGIRPEEVIPYYTSLSPLGEEILPADIANAVLYLVSDDGAKVTGQTLVVDGGQVMVR